MSAAAAELFSWATGEGATLGVEPCHSALGGLGCRATESASSGAELMRCPLRLVLRASMALSDPTIGGPLTTLRGELGEAVLDTRFLLCVLLLHCRRQGPSSFFSAYVQCLPGDELVKSLPCCWSDAELEARLSGTPLLGEARRGRQQLEETHEVVLRHGLCARWPKVFPCASYTLAALRWADAMFWSRAISVPVGSLATSLKAGVSEQCLVPLLDLCNHRPGSVADLAVLRAPASGAAAGAASVPGAVSDTCWVLRAGCAVERGEEVLINYGAKGNGELLRAHGFVLDDNAADVYSLDLAPLLPADASARRARTDACAALLGLCDASHCFLHRGGLPRQLLQTARLLCASDDDLLKAQAEAQAEETPFDWSACDWSADDPFANTAAADTGEVVGQAALDALLALLREGLAALDAACSSPPPPTQGGAGACERAATYRAGMRRLLQEAIEAVEARAEEEGRGGELRQGYETDGARKRPRTS